MLQYVRSFTAVLLLLTPLTLASISHAAGIVFSDGFESGNTNLWAQDTGHTRCPVVTAATDAGLGPRTGTKMVRCRWDGGYESLTIASLPYTNEIFYRAWLRIDTNMDRTDTSPIKFLRIFVPPNGSNYRDLFEGISSTVGVHGLTLRGNAGNNLIATYWGDEPNADVSANTTAWHKVEYYINHTTQNIKIWHDGLLIKNDTVSFNSVKWYPFYLTSNWSDAHDSTNDLYFDDIEIYSDLNSGATGLMSDASITSGGGGQTVPSPPTNTQVN